MSKSAIDSVPERVIDPSIKPGDLICYRDIGFRGFGIFEYIVDDSVKPVGTRHHDVAKYIRENKLCAFWDHSIFFTGIRTGRRHRISLYRLTEVRKASKNELMDYIGEHFAEFL